MFHERIQALSDESQTCHLEMLENFKLADEIRKEANMYHAQLTDKITNINSIKEKKLTHLRLELLITGRNSPYTLIG